MSGTARDFSHVTQTGFFIAVKGSAQTTIIFAGDRWSDFAGNGAGYNQTGLVDDFVLSRG